MKTVTWFFLIYLICCEAASCLTMAAQTNLNITTDRYAPLALKACITNDPQNIVFTNWSTTTPVCNWVGVTYGASHHRIAELNVSYFGLTCTIPWELGNLSFLVVLDFKNNSFHGILPQELACLRRLKFISLRNNRFMGVIPSWFGSLFKLQVFNLFGNQFSGSIPATIFNLSALQKIDLSYNQLSVGMCVDFLEIPNEIGTLNHLEKLFVQYNVLKGPIPMTIFNMSSLITVTFYGNNLTGRIPDNICQNLSNIQELNLGANQFNGPLPSIFGQCKQLLQLNLKLNSLTGPIPYGNQLSGSVPSCLEFIEGPIPSSFATCLSLELLNLSQNSLSGVIPKSLEALSYLKYLNLSFNRLQGEIPSGGPFINFSAESFVSNHGLCGGSQFQVPPCKRKTSITILKKKNATAAAHIILMPQVLRRRVSYQELLCATDGFNESNLLGIGGFGSVYKGTFPDETDVAIKVFNLDLEGAFASFEVECEMLSNVHHRNLVKVISCCSQIDFKGLVLNYMPNGSHEKWLYSQSSSLDLVQSNILLDDDMVAHVADFGIARLLGGGDSMTQTMTLATIGYIAPEYGMEGIVTRRGDVYSFGIVVMETFTRRKPTDEIFIGEMRLSQWEPCLT
ncbi:putative protein kinase RLK-Pelle-LRR-XII-1 family [Rosa chinensis]|uniref:Protein kinase domain-containing protein n=1 Tax=Rosa chinensis TaxID=74649 RepID=A0A2P6RQM0_ROSCH|nr:putative protein kinase RLK-Pelle-LRR-XII-1 family [Rosa chinensis]